MTDFNQTYRQRPRSPQTRWLRTGALVASAAELLLVAYHRDTTSNISRSETLLDLSERLVEIADGIAKDIEAENSLLNEV